jgi:hypothetical protein
MPKRTHCIVIGCETKVYSKTFCVLHYRQNKRGVELELEPEPSNVPKIAPDKKRCRSRMRDGSQCVRPIKAKGLCSAHHREAEDRAAFGIREQPLDSTLHDYEGDEASLIAAMERKSAN